MPEEKENTKEEENSKIEPLSWRAAEYQFTKKGPLWYLTIGLIGLILLIIALKQKNFFFGLFILIAGTVIFYLGRRRPKVINFTIDDEGVKIGKYTVFRYDQLEKFSFRQNPNQLDEIILKRKTIFNPYLILPIDSTNLEKAKNILKEKLEEFEYEPSFLDIFTNWLGF